MHQVIFYEDRRGRSAIVEYPDMLQQKGLSNKDARVKRQKILAYMSSLQELGTRMGEPYVKYIRNDIRELRPLDNRVFFFYWKDNTFVMLHHYIKKTKKMPRLEIERAISNRNDWLQRSGK